MQKCNGHFGYVKLALPAMHIGYLKKIITVLQNICKVRNVPRRKTWRLMTTRDVHVCFFQRRNAELSSGTCADQISITYGRFRSARK